MVVTETLGDYVFLIERRQDGKYIYKRRLLNTPGAEFEEIPHLDEVPVEIIRAGSLAY